MSIELRVAKCGNSLAMRLPAELVRRLGLRAGSSVRVKFSVSGALTAQSGGEGWSRRAFAAELAAAREALPPGPPVIEELRGAPMARNAARIKP